MNLSIEASEQTAIAREFLGAIAPAARVHDGRRVVGRKMLLDELAGGPDDVLRTKRAGAHVVEHDHIEAAGERGTIRPNIFGQRPAPEQLLLVPFHRDFDSGKRVDFDWLAVFEHLKVVARQPAHERALLIGDDDIDVDVVDLDLERHGGRALGTRRLRSRAGKPGSTSN